MEKKKALLMLTGGRLLPELLAIKYLKPSITFNITTKQGLRSAQYLEKLAHSEFNCKMKVMPPINPYNEQEIKKACLSLLGSEPDMEWIITITSAPKIMSIYAMDVARSENIPCWFLNTDEGELISLSKDISVNNDLLFDITVEQYMKAYERVYEIPESKDYRKTAEGWYDVARALAYRPKATQALLKALRSAQQRNPIKLSISFTLATDADTTLLLNELQSYGMLTIDHQTHAMSQCTVIGGDGRKFLNGSWLEVYVWKQVKEAGFVQDHQWGYEIINGQARNEIDVAFTYKGLLMIAECKTDDDPFTSNRKVYLDTLDSAAGLLGRDFVGKFFVTNHPEPETVPSFAAFSEQARQRRIYVITGQGLRDIGKTLKQQTINPFFERK